MKLILATDDAKEFEAVAVLLQDNGIPVHIPDDYSDVPGFRVGARVRSLYVWLDHQFEEAVALLRDPEHHVVKNPVDWDEFEKVHAKVSTEAEEAIDRGHEVAMNWLIGAGVLALLAFGAYQIFRA